MIRGSLFGCVLAVCVLAVAVASAGAAVTPFVLRLPESFDATQDGTDVYFSDMEKGNSGDFFLKRASMVDGQIQRLASYRADDGFFPDTIYSGGGFAFVGMYSDEFESENTEGTHTKIVRISRDGTSTATLAEGTVAAGPDEEVIVRKKRALLNDCGTTVDVQAVSATGDVAIQETIAERESAACGGKPNVNHVRLFVVRPDGTSKDIYRYDTTIKKRLHVDKRGHWWGSRNPSRQDIGFVSLSGDLAVFGLGAKSLAFVSNFVTGATSGPYSTGLNGKRGFTWATADPAGRLALAGFQFKKQQRRYKDSVKFEVGVVRTPGDPASYVKYSSKSSLQFCGAHLVAFKDREVAEIDPLTFAVTRTIFSMTKRESELLSFECTGNWVHTHSYGHKGKKDVFKAYPLG